MKVVVVGAGIVGLSTAWSLRRRGCDVVIISADPPGTGASGVNAGWVAPALSGPVPGPGVLTGSLRWLLNPASPFYVRPRMSPSFLRWMLEFRARCNARDYAAGIEVMAALNRRTMELYDDLRVAGVGFEQQSSGLVMAFRSRRDHDHELEGSGWMAASGYPLPVTGLPQDFEPGFSDAVVAAYLLPGERHVDPAVMSVVLAERLSRDGVEVRRASVSAVTAGRRVAPGSPASGGDSGPMVTTADGPIRGDAIVVAAGAWTPLLTRGLGARVPIIAGKGYGVDFDPAPVRLSRPVYLHEDRVGVSPYGDHLRLAGTMELTGLDMSVSRRRSGAIASAGPRAFRDWPGDARPERVAAGLRPLTPDGLPVIGRLAQAPGVYVAAGHSMLGMTLGPATGEALAAEICGEPQEVLRPFDPARFGRG
jgi:D-amino-acid dehydrogenase